MWYLIVSIPDLCPLSYFAQSTPIRERPFDFYVGPEDSIGPGFFFSERQSLTYLFFAWYGPGFFLARIMRIKK